MDSIASGWMWGAFAAAVGVMLAIDLAGAGRAHRVSLREAAGWSVAWVAAAAIFGCGLFLYLDGSAGREVARDTTLAFATGYLIEKSLAIDNVFVWLMLFTFFAVPGELQRRVLVYGVLGAIAMRTGMIFGGAWLVESFDWILYVFGAILIFTGVKMWWFAGQAPDLAGNPIVRWLRSTLRMTEGYEGERFFVVRREGGRSLVYATPLFLVLVLVEAADVVFAVDSVPAIFAITTDPFIVLTSNVFAILGLRAMFFLLADMASRFALLKYGLALVLVLVGAKMLLIEVVKIPVAVSLAAVTAIVGGSIVWSLVRARRAPGPPAVSGSAAPGQARPAR